MAEKLFYKDQYLKRFTANIIQVEETDNKIIVVLDKTAFFPGGGGQWCDKGTIDGIEVLDVYEEDEEIYHVLKSKPEKLKEVECEISWETRLDGMQQHLGQHVLSGVFFSTYSANTAGIHLGKDISYVDIVGQIQKEQIINAEKIANKVISEKHNVKFIMTNREDALKMGLRRDLATDDEWIRVVEIEDLDINACCGVHPSNTFDLQMIKIKASEKHKGNTRVYFLAGNRAVNEYINKSNEMDRVCSLLSTGYEEAYVSLNALKNNYENAKEENKKLKMSLAKYECIELVNKGEKINDITIVSNIYHNENMKFLNQLSQNITDKEKMVVLFATEDGEKANLLFAVSKDLKNINAGAILKEAIEHINGKGGGSPFLAQGGGSNINGIEMAIKCAVEKIKQSL